MKEKIPQEKSDEEKEEILETFKIAKEDLKETFGVDDLTTIEGVRLRKIVEQCVKQEKKESGLKEQGKTSGKSNIIPEYEASQRWLLELYGLNPKDIPYDFVILDETTDKNYTFSTRVWEDTLTKNRERNEEGKSSTEKAIEKYHELKDLGHDVEFKEGVPNYFKEYIRRQREKAHKP